MIANAGVAERTVASSAEEVIKSEVVLVDKGAQAGEEYVAGKAGRPASWAC